MNSNEEKIRAAVAEQACEWLVANDEGPLDAQNSAALVAWLTTSPVHIEEFLAVSAIGRDLKEAHADPEYSLQAILARARAEEDTSTKSSWSRAIDKDTGWVQPPRRWSPAAAAMAGIAVLTVGALFAWNAGLIRHPSGSEVITALNFATRHGEQLTQRLADNSVLHLNTDSAVSIRYNKSERLVTLVSGQAEFDVTHDSHRAFRVHAGAAEVTDLGTKFDVHLDQGSTVVTVIEGRVAVGPAGARGPMDRRQSGASQLVELKADQQIRVTEGQWPAAPVTVDAERASAWLHGQVAFDNEPLALVAAELNRYASKPIEIETPALGVLKISGVFATDDPEAFIAFLRSLKGVRVEVTETQIRVSTAG
jgi:transmembrane sensor